MIRQDWMIIVAGSDLVDAMSVETKSRCQHTGNGYNSDQLCQLQREQAGRGITGVEIVQSIYGYSVRYDSGLQGFGLLVRSRDLGGTLKAAEAYCRNWVAQEPLKRYAWRRIWLIKCRRGKCRSRSSSKK